VLTEAPARASLEISEASALPGDDVLRGLGVTAAGLSAAEAARRLASDGPNAVSSHVVAALGVVTIGAVLPATPFTHTLGFQPLPAGFFAALAGMVVCYLALIEVGKRLFYGVAPEPTTLPAPRRPSPAPPGRVLQCRHSSGTTGDLIGPGGGPSLRIRRTARAGGRRCRLGGCCQGPKGSAYPVGRPW
jgi:hypothetical protein